MYGFGATVGGLHLGNAWALKMFLGPCGGLTNPITTLGGVLIQRKAPAGRAWSLTRVGHFSLLSHRHPIAMLAFGSAPFGRAVSLYRSKCSDCPVGTVANSYPNVDLLWDNVIAGP